MGALFRRDVEIHINIPIYLVVTMQPNRGKNPYFKRNYPSFLWLHCLIVHWSNIILLPINIGVEKSAFCLNEAVCGLKSIKECFLI